MCRIENPNEEEKVHLKLNCFLSLKNKNTFKDN